MVNKLKLLEDMINGVSVSTFIYRNYKDVDNLIESVNIILNTVKEDEINSDLIKSFYSKAINDIQIIINKNEEELIPELLNDNYSDVYKLSKILDKLYTLHSLLNDKLLKIYKYRNEKILVLDYNDKLDKLLRKTLKDIKIIESYKIKGSYTYIGDRYTVVASTLPSAIYENSVFKKIITTTEFYENNKQLIEELAFGDLEII